MPFGRRFAALGIALLLGLAAPAARAAELEAPRGPVVVTVGGNIQHTNRGPFDPDQDLFLKYHERSFTRAAAFDRAMLEGLGLHAVTIALQGWPDPVTLEGPYLRDLVAAVGGAGRTVTLVALDGYGSEISWADLQGLDWIVGLRQDGRPLGLGQRGPLWVVYTYPDGRALTMEDEGRWPWATFYIEIE
ncbi:MAG: hypothetical protein ACFB13_20125 [Kiloniellaceae bacterium]